MENGKEYYAFISYKREDEKWAKWLQNKLEHYRFPTNLNGRTDLPKNIRPTFRDVTDLNPGLLAEEINKALRSSEWLIVVCSPRSAKSPWVCKEAQTFIDLGRADHIIPFVIEGYPFSNDSTTECYPEALLNLTGSKELLAANINEMGRDAAVIKVVARMFNLRFDALWQRYEREQSRKKWIWIVGSVLFASLGLGIGGYFVRQNRIIEKQNYSLQQDSIIMANHLMRIQGDSILLSVRNDSIAHQNIIIKNQRDSLGLSNKLLAEERDNVIKANLKMMKNRGRFLADEIERLTNNGDIYTAQRIGAELYYEKRYISGISVPELECAIRNTYTSMSYQVDTFFKSSPTIKVSPYTSLAILREHNKPVWHIGLSSDNRTLITSDSHIICFSNPNTGKLLKKWDGYLLQCSDDGKFIAYKKGNKIFIRNVETDEIRFILSMPSEQSASAMNICFAPTGMMIFCFSYGWVGAYDITQRQEIEFEPNAVNSKLNAEFMEGFCFDKTGDKILMVPSNILNPDSVIILDLKEKTMNVINQDVSYATFYGNDIITCNKPNNIIGFWRFDGSKYICKRQVSANCFKSNGIIRHLAFSPKDNLMAVALDNKIILWDLKRNKEIQTIVGHNDIVNEIVFSNDGEKLFSCSSDNTIRVWTSRNRVNNQKYSCSELIHCASYDKNSKYVISGSDKYIHLWDANSKNELWKNPFTDKAGFLEESNFVTFSKTGKYIASARKNTVSVRNSTSGDFISTIAGHLKKVNYIAFSQDDKLIATASDDNTIRLWEVNTGKLIRVIEGHSYLVESVEFSRDGITLLSASGDHSVRLWNYSTGAEIMRYNGSLGQLMMAKFSPDEKYIAACGSDKFIHLWERTTGREISVFKGHQNIVTSVSFSPSGKYIVSSSWDGCIKVWDISSNMEIMNYYTGSNHVNCASFSADGVKILFICSGRIHEIDFLPFGQLTMKMMNKFRDYRLSKEELKKYYLE